MPKLPKVSTGSYVGVDPGKQGGIVRIIDLGGGKVDVSTILMPASPLDLVKQLEACEATYAVVEHVTSSPQMGVSSSFTFGQGFGRIESAMAALRIPTEYVRPQTWHKALGIVKRDKKWTQTQWKEKMISRAHQLFPSIPLWDENKGIQLALADALLIAVFCMRKHKGVI